MSYRQNTDHWIFRKVRSTTTLVLLAGAMGLALASTIGVVVWIIASALHHAATS